MHTISQRGRHDAPAPAANARTFFQPIPRRSEMKINRGPTDRFQPIHRFSSEAIQEMEMRRQRATPSYRHRGPAGRLMLRTLLRIDMMFLPSRRWTRLILRLQDALDDTRIELEETAEALPATSSFSRAALGWLAKTYWLQSGIYCPSCASPLLSSNAACLLNELILLPKAALAAATRLLLRFARIGRRSWRNIGRFASTAQA